MTKKLNFSGKNPIMLILTPFFQKVDFLTWGKFLPMKNTPF